MSRSVNKVILIGNLGRDPEMKYTPGGQAVTRLGLATNERWKDKNGEFQERTEWHTVVCWGKLAETASQYLTKGQSVYIEGRLQTRNWEDKENKKHYSTEIIANEMVMLGGRGGGQSRDAARAAGAGSGPGEPYSQESGTPPAVEGGITDDDVPF